MPLQLTVEAPVRQSEDEQKVRRAMLNLFPDLHLRREGDRLVGEGASLARFADLVRRHRIRDAARGQLLHGRRGREGTDFWLNKQAAFMERVSFAERKGPLGDIRISLRDEDIDRVIDRVAPDTRPPAARLSDEKGKADRSFGARQVPHTRQRLDPQDLLGRDPLEEE